MQVRLNHIAGNFKEEEAIAFNYILSNLNWLASRRRINNFSQIVKMLDCSEFHNAVAEEIMDDQENGFIHPDLSHIANYWLNCASKVCWEIKNILLGGKK